MFQGLLADIVVNERTSKMTGQYRFGTRNERGESLIEFCPENQLIIANTYFKQHPRKLYTWKSPDGKNRNQMDYILISKRFRNCVKQAKTYPGADINSDHNPLLIKMKIQLEKLNKTKINNTWIPIYLITARMQLDTIVK